MKSKIENYRGQVHIDLFYKEQERRIKKEVKRAGRKTNNK